MSLYTQKGWVQICSQIWKGQNSPHLPLGGRVLSEQKKELCLTLLQAWPPPGLQESSEDMFFGNSKHQGQRPRGIWANSGERRCTAIFQNMYVSACVSVSLCMPESTLTLMLCLGMTDAFLSPPTKWGCYEALRTYKHCYDASDIQQAIYKGYLIVICSLHARLRSLWGWGLWISYCLSLSA